MIYCYLLRYVQSGHVCYYRGISARPAQRLNEHRRGKRPWEGPAIEMRVITTYLERAEAMAWEKRIARIDHADKISLWNMGEDVLLEAGN